MSDDRIISESWAIVTDVSGSPAYLSPRSHEMSMIDIDHKQRIKHRNRIAYASPCVLGLRAKGGPRQDRARNNTFVYVIDGIPGQLFGSPKVIEKLETLHDAPGIKGLEARIRKATVTQVGPYTVRKIGTVRRGSTGEIRTDTIAKGVDA